MKCETIEKNIKKHVTADTNIFYYLGDGRIKKNDVVSNDEALWATPISIIEIISGAQKKWPERIAAVKAIIQNADYITPDPDEYFMSRVEDRAPNAQAVWIEYCKAMAQATSEEHLRQGVIDINEKKVRSIDIDCATQHRWLEYKTFYDNINSTCDDFVPGYAAALGRPPALTEMDGIRKIFRREFSTLSPFTLVPFVFWRLNYCARKFNRRDLFVEAEIDRAIDASASYVAVYSSYMTQHLTASNKLSWNDAGDLELFHYLQPNHYVATGESIRKKWGPVLNQAGLVHRVRWIKAI